MGSEKYKLKWSKYESNILSAFHGLLESENLSDVTLFCEGQTFKAHRLVLAACSTHFENLFNHTPVNAPLNNQFFVILDGTRADDLQILLHFMYRGEAYLHQDRINSVLRTAEVLQVKGLSEGPRNIEINQNMHGSSGGGTASSRSWSPSLSNPDASPRHKKKEMDHRDDSPLLRRPGSPMHIGSGRMSPGYSTYSQQAGSTREPFPMFPGSAVRGMSSTTSYRSNNHDPSPSGGNGYSPPPLRSKSPPPPPHGLRAPYPSSSKFMSAPSPPPHPSSTETNIKDEDPSHPSATASAPGASPSATDMYEVRSTSSDRPPSAKTDRQTPNDYDRRTPSSIKNVTAASTFPSDSTTDASSSVLLRASSSSAGLAYSKDEQQRMRRASDPGAVDDAASVASDELPRTKFTDFRASRDDLARLANSSPSERNSGDIRMSEEEVRNQVAAVNNLETFRRIAQAHAERNEQLLPRGGVLPRGIPNVSLTPGLTASDYMRFAMPVRDPDNGDAISGSGTKLRCPFCERTYGYETNLRAHIRQRHQGIRVSCPYCPRTFTRNNTVRRHVQREHRHMVGRIPTKFGSTRVMPDPLTAAASVLHVQQQQQQQQAQQSRPVMSPPSATPPDSLGKPGLHP